MSDTTPVQDEGELPDWLCMNEDGDWHFTKNVKTNEETYGCIKHPWEDGCTIPQKLLKDLIARHTLAVLEEVSNRLDELHQGTEGAGFVHYGEMGDWLDDYIAAIRQRIEKGDKT